MATKPESGITAYSKTPEAGVTSQDAQQPQETQDTSGGGYGGYGGGGGGYGGGGGGGGGGGSSSQPAGTTPEEQAKNQAQINNLGDIYAKRAKDLGNIGAKQLENIEQQKAANDSLFAQQKRQINTSVQWQPNQQKEQSTLMALRNRMGNAAYGSAIQDLREGMGRVDDMNDVELINAYKQNMDTAEQNWYQANAALVADYNDQISSLKDEFSKLKSNWWTSVSNINPELASKKNVKKALSSKTARQAKEAKAGLKKAKAALKKAQKSKNKAQQKFAKDKVRKYKNDYEKFRVSIGKGNDKYYLPSVNLGPSDSLKALMAYQKPGEAQSTPMVRPADARYIPPTPAAGTYQTATTANSGFSDNLAAFRRV